MTVVKVLIMRIIKSLNQQIILHKFKKLVKLNSSVKIALKSIIFMNYGRTYIFLKNSSGKKTLGTQALDHV